MTGDDRSGYERGGTGVRAARQTRSAERRAEMVRAAVDAVRRLGAAVSMSQIAAVAGITKPVLYRFFTDRADLQNAVSELAVTALVDRVTDELRRDRDPVGRVRVVIDQFLRGVDEDAELWRFILRDPARVGIRTGVVEDARAHIARVLTTVLTDRLRDAGRDDDGAETWALGLFGMVYAAADWWLNSRTMSRAVLCAELSTLVWGGLSGVLGAERPAANAPESGVEINATEDFG